MENDLARQLLNETLDDVIATTPAGEVVYWSKGAESIFGYTTTEATGQKLIDLVIPGDRLDEERRIVAEALIAELVVHETIRRRKDGSLIYVDISTKAVRNSAGS